MSPRLNVFCSVSNKVHGVVYIVWCCTDEVCGDTASVFVMAPTTRLVWNQQCLRCSTNGVFGVWYQRCGMDIELNVFGVLSRWRVLYQRCVWRYQRYMCCGINCVYVVKAAMHVVAPALSVALPYHTL